ncbi:MAG: YbhB/YbcL family Raf kinase inhibitor-like protein [Candidatus Thiodiazotropha sp. 6PLUC2]
MKKKTVALLSTIALTPYANASEFILTSPQISEGGRIAEEQVFNGFGCEGANLSPELHWKNAPEGTKSFAITMYDPDAPTGSGWWHWSLYNIPVEVSSLDKGASSSLNRLPEGSSQGETDFGKPGYGGPCPPAGDAPHRYKITVYALKTDNIDLSEDAPAAMLGFYLHQNLIDKAVLSGYYSR